MNDDDRHAPAGPSPEMAGPSRTWKRGALTLVLVGIAIWAYGRGAEDWRWQLAGAANPFLGHPSPGLGVAVNVVISALVGCLTLLGRAVVRGGVRSSSAHARSGVRWRWWWLLAAGWAGYAVGSTVVIARGGSIDYRGSMHVEVGAPFGSVTDEPATCRSVVGDPELVAEVYPAANGFTRIILRDIATGMRREQLAFWTDAVGNNAYEPPNVPDRPAPYRVMTLRDGSTVVDSPITFVQAYGYHVTRLAESGLSGVVELTGARFANQSDGPYVRWVNVAIADDPWPETYKLSISWTCDPTKP